MRLSVSQPARVIIDSGREIPCVIADFCMGGLFLRFDAPEAGRASLKGRDGGHVRILFTTPEDMGSHDFVLSARLVRLSENGVGVAFGEKPVAALLALNKVAAARYSGNATAGPKGDVDIVGIRTVSQENLVRAVTEGFDNFAGFIGPSLERASHSEKSETEKRSLQDSAQTVLEGVAAVQRRSLDLLQRRFAILGGEMAGGGEATDENLDFDDWISITAVSSRLADRFILELDMLDRRLGQIFGLFLDDKNSPFSPAVILNEIKLAFAELSLPLPVRLSIDSALYDSLEEPLARLYRDMLNLLPEFDDTALPAADVDAAGSADIRAEQEEATLGSVAGALMGYARVGEGEKKYTVSLPASALNMLKDLVESGKIPAERRDQATLSANVFSKLISAVGEEKSLPADVQPYLMQLEDALLRLALLDPSYLSNPEHPAHTLLNTMDRLSLVSSDDGRIADQRILDQISAWVTHIRREAESNPSVFDEIRTQVENALRPLMKERTARIAYLQASLEGWQKTGQSNRRVLQQLEQRVAGRSVPEVVLDLFMSGWRNYLIRVMLRNGEGSSEEVQAWEAVDKLLDWLGKDPGIKPAFQEVQRLLENVDSCLKLVCPEKDVQDRLMERLTRQLLGQEETIYRTVTSVLPRDTGEMGEAPAGSDADDPLDTFRVGDWVSFEGFPMPLNLIWIGDDPVSYVFCNYKGIKKLELGREDFLQRLASGNARIAENLELPLMDRSFSSTIQHIHRDLLQQAAVDEQTGLSQQREFMRLAAARLLKQTGLKPDAPACGQMMGVLDIESLRVMRPRLGKEGYEELMRALARHLEKVVEPGLLSHNSDYTFAFLLQVSSPEEMQSLSERILSEVNHFSFKRDGVVHTLSANLGVVYSVASRDPEELFNRADEACLEAKHMGRNQIVLRHAEGEFGQGRNWLEEWSAWITELLDGGHLNLRCQPIVRTRSDSAAPSHYEILLGVKPSWDKPHSVGVMMAAVEQLRRAIEVDQWVIKEVFTWIRENAESMENIGGLSINLSAQSINSRNFLGFLCAEMEQGNIPGEKIIFEITESAAIDSFAHAERFIRQMRRYGCRFALDDFGVGFSSFSYLKNLKVDYLKIDGSFVRNMSQNEIDVALVSSMHETGRFLGLETVAEVVENLETLDILKRIGVNYAQGFFTGRPMQLAQLAISAPAPEPAGQT